MLPPPPPLRASALLTCFYLLIFWVDLVIPSSLGSNRIQGTIPSDIGRLVNLGYVFVPVAAPHFRFRCFLC
jgi:hypothetical protein